MTAIELAKKHGYDDVAQAQKAIVEASHWLKKYPGKRAPVHVKRAVALVVEMEKLKLAEHTRVRKKIALLSRNPRFWFGAIVVGSRFERARRWARRKFKLYLTPKQMGMHFSGLMPDDFMQYWRASSDVTHTEAIDSLTDSIVKMYGLADGRNNPFAMIEDRFVPWVVGKNVAWTIVSDKLKE
jgi:hypothetical protein